MIDSSAEPCTCLKPYHIPPSKAKPKADSDASLQEQCTVQTTKNILSASESHHQTMGEFQGWINGHGEVHLDTFKTTTVGDIAAT